MATPRDCRTCKHNPYVGIPANAEWVDCSHPITMARGPRWQAGDPAFVNYRTGDVHVSRIDEIGECVTWEAAQEDA